METKELTPAELVEIKQCLTIHRVLRNGMADTAWKLPTLGDSVRFTVGEAYEVMDAEMRAIGGYARNNEKDSKIAVELADVIIMAHSALMVMDKTMAEAAVEKLLGRYAPFADVDGHFTDELIVLAAQALDVYVSFSLKNRDDTQRVLASELADIIHVAYKIMKHFGYVPLTWVKNKCQAQALKHGENHEKGFGLALSDQLETYYNGFMGTQ